VTRRKKRIKWIGIMKVGMMMKMILVKRGMATMTMMVTRTVDIVERQVGRMMEEDTIMMTKAVMEARKRI